MPGAAGPSPTGCRSPPLPGLPISRSAGAPSLVIAGSFPLCRYSRGSRFPLRAAVPPAGRCFLPRGGDENTAIPTAEGPHACPPARVSVCFWAPAVSCCVAQPGHELGAGLPAAIPAVGTRVDCASPAGVGARWARSPRVVTPRVTPLGSLAHTQGCVGGRVGGAPGRMAEWVGGLVGGFAALPLPAGALFGASVGGCGLGGARRATAPGARGRAGGHTWTPGVCHRGHVRQAGGSRGLRGAAALPGGGPASFGVGAGCAPRRVPAPVTC